ncbi:MAG: protein translocase subunit SecDF [Bacteroidota bacterium]
MQNKGVIKFLAIAFALVCMYQLSFTLITRHIESNAAEYSVGPQAQELAKKLSKGDQAKEQILFDSIKTKWEAQYLDSMNNEVVYNLLIRKYTYKECKQREINLGLDLKGGMNVTLEVSVVDIIRALAGNSQDVTFNKAVTLASEMEKTSTKDFVTLFGEAWNATDPNAKMAGVFLVGLKDKINFNSTNEEVLAKIRTETNDAIDRTYNILRSRIDRFGVAQPNIQKLQTAGRILVELPGIKDPERVRKLLQGTAKLEFWETYEYKDIYAFMEQADVKMKSLMGSGDTITKPGDSLNAEKSTDSLSAKKDTSKSLVDKAGTDTSGKNKPGQQSFDQFAKEHPLTAYLQPALVQDEQQRYFPAKGPVVGYCNSIDTFRVNAMLRNPIIKAIFPRELRFAWTVKPVGDKLTTLQLIALKATRDGTAALGGDVIVDARQDIAQNQGNEISMSMNSEGASQWKNITANNLGKSVAIVLDNYVYSFPTVQSEIPNGHSSITGNFTVEEAKDLANILKAGKLPAPARIVEEAVVGPTLGKEAINAGLWSIIVAFLVTLAYMAFYYNKAGLVADVALFTNMFFVFGILASLGAVLTLPGIAGIVLTIGMDVDKNVIIYERIREELRIGKGIRLAISDGYKHAYSSIIDSNVTTLLTGIVLYVFGSGPVQGFATTLIIGIISSLFCSIFITRIIFVWMMDKNIKIDVWNRFTKNILTKVHIDFIGIRKYYYVLSLILVLAGIISLSVRGLSYGIDFLGGRSYVVRFDSDVKVDDVRAVLEKVFDGQRPEVKTFGPNDQVKITTSYMINDKSATADSIVETKLYTGLAPMYKNSLSAKEFQSHAEKKVLGKLSSQKVEPTIAYSLLLKAYWAVFLSLIIIFIYVAIRFKKWQWGLGAVVSLFHDTFITISIFSLLYGILPFSLDIDQHFIAAILTIIGYSIMDSVIIFDRIREYMNLYPKRDMKTNMNDAINSTLGRTLNTSGITFLVLLSMFIFGGEVIRGFAFALLFGVVIGTYSSILNASPVAYDLIRMIGKGKEKKELKPVKA